MYQCQPSFVQNWIKLSKPQNYYEAQIYNHQKIKQLNKKNIQTINHQNHQYDTILSQKKTILNQKQKSSYISQIFSLQKTVKRSKKSELKPKSRLLYHNYQKYKTIPFNFDKIYLPNQQISTVVSDLAQRIHNNLVQSKQNISVLCYGGYMSQIQSMIELNKNSNQGLIYKLIIKLNQNITSSNEEYNKNQEIKMSVNFMAVSQSKIIDLMDINNQIYFKQQNSQKNSNKNNLNQFYNFQKDTFLDYQNFIQPKTYQFISNYQLYTKLKNIFLKRKQLNCWTALLVKINYRFIDENGQVINKHALLVQWIKDSMNIYPQNIGYQTKRNQGQKPLLSLNQSILQILKFYEQRERHPDNQHIRTINAQNQTNYMVFNEMQLTKLYKLQSFRNSLITRILKDYLQQCSTVHLYFWDAVQQMSKITINPIKLQCWEKTYPKSKF